MNLEEYEGLGDWYHEQGVHFYQNKCCLDKFDEKLKC